MTRREALESFDRLVRSGSGGVVFTPNVDHVVTAESNVEFRRAYDCADLSLTDGMPLVWASPLMGARLPERVAGSDIFIPLMRLAARRGWRVYLFGTSAAVAEAAANRLHTDFGVTVVGCDSPPVTSAGVDLDPCATDRIRLARPDVIIVALGSPKQELWSARVRAAVAPAVLVGLGAALDFFVGSQKRAPQWMAAIGLEWFHRLLHEPRRLWRRYLIRDPRFAKIVLTAWWAARRTAEVRM